MSLRPLSDYQAPEQTEGVARAAFPASNLCIRIYDEIGTIFQDQDFADLFSQRGQPAQSPFRLALVTILQFLEDLSDRQAADAVRGRIDWKFLLCLELDDPGFDFSVLSEFRARLLEAEAERRLFDRLLAVLEERQLVKARGKQRTDSTHVLAAVRELDRLERVGETLRAALNTISTVEPDWIRVNIPTAWADRYGKRIEEYRLPSEEPKRKVYAAMVGADGAALLDALWSPQTPIWMRSIPAVETLRRVWIQNYLVIEGELLLREKENLPPASICINSPYDVEARYGHKRSTTWVGYKVHLTESCDEERPHLITNVETEESIINDNVSLPKIHQRLAQAELLPNKHLVDSGYTGTDHYLESRKKYEIDLIGPAPNNYHWQQTLNTGFDLSHFQIDWEQKHAICPAGKLSSSWKPGKDNHGHDVINVQFAASDCKGCENLSLCTKSKTKKRTINIKPQEQYEALRNARDREKTREFKEEYSLRAGVEGTISQGVRACDLRRSRYIGMAKTRLQHLSIAAAINLKRVADWFAGIDRETTRRSAFIRVMNPLPT
jgi:transposase